MVAQSELRPGKHSGAQLPHRTRCYDGTGSNEYGATQQPPKPRAAIDDPLVAVRTPTHRQPVPQRTSAGDAEPNAEDQRRETGRTGETAWGNPDGPRFQRLGVAPRPPYVDDAPALPAAGVGGSRRLEGMSAAAALNSDGHASSIAPTWRHRERIEESGRPFSYVNRSDVLLLALAFVVALLALALWLT